MDPAGFTPLDGTRWRLEPVGAMRVPALIHASEALLREMDDKVGAQLAQVAALPGVVGAVHAMPDAHWGYGFPIGGVAAFDATTGIVSAGGVGFDIACGVRLLTTGLTRAVLQTRQETLARSLARAIPAGLGSTGRIVLADAAMDAMLAGGARWAVAQGYGHDADLARIEEGGAMVGAAPEAVSARARERQRAELGTLGSGNHYLEVQAVDAILDAEAAARFGLVQDQIVVSLHCGSRGLGHQIATEFLRAMVLEAPEQGIVLPDLDLACARVDTPLGQRYLGAMRAAINCALANRQVLTQIARRVFAHVFPGTQLTLLYDVSHNTCKTETHRVGGRARRLLVHRKGATRAFAGDHPDLPAPFRGIGQPVLVGGSMGTASFVMAGPRVGEGGGFASSCHGAGRCLSRHAAVRRWEGRAVQDDLRARGILVVSPSRRGIAEEAPGAYKDSAAVIEAASRAGLSRPVVRLAPLICIKG
jgi:tRNA-splicing ligase RtcB